MSRPSNFMPLQDSPWEPRPRSRTNSYPLSWTTFAERGRTSKCTYAPIPTALGSSTRSIATRSTSRYSSTPGNALGILGSPNLPQPWSISTSVRSP